MFGSFFSFSLFFSFLFGYVDEDEDEDVEKSFLVNLLELCISMYLVYRNCLIGVS